MGSHTFYLHDNCLKVLRVPRSDRTRDVIGRYGLLLDSAKITGLFNQQDIAALVALCQQSDLLKGIQPKMIRGLLARHWSGEWSDDNNAALADSHQVSHEELLEKLESLTLLQEVALIEHIESIIDLVKKPAKQR